MLSGLALAVVAVVSYAPHGDVDATRLVAVSTAMKVAAKAQGARVVDGAFGEAKAAHAAGWRKRSRWVFFEQARAASDEGRQALERVELERAVTAFTRAERILTAERASPGVDVLLAETLLQKGIALYELGRSEESSAAFARAAGLDPDVKLSEARVRPAVVAAFTKAAARARQTPDAIERVLGDADADVAARLTALERAPEVESLKWMCEVLGLDGVWIASASTRGDAMELVAQYVAADGSIGARGAERAANLADVARAAAVAMQKARAGTQAAELSLVSRAPRIPPGATPGGPAPKKKLKLWQRPWLWASILAGASAIVIGVTLGVDSSSGVSARLDGSGFGLK